MRTPERYLVGELKKKVGYVVKGAIADLVGTGEGRD